MKNEDRFNNSEFFGAKYNRNRNVGHYGKVAEVMQRHFSGKKMLEVGCGMGWITDILRKRGEDCIGFDISHEAISKRLNKDVFQADLLDYGKPENSREVVVCSNVMAYFEESEVEAALTGIGNLFTENAVISIQTEENIIRNFGSVDLARENGRRCFKSWDWWLYQMNQVDLILDKEKHFEVSSDPEGLVTPDGTGRPVLFVLKHKEID